MGLELFGAQHTLGNIVASNKYGSKHCSGSALLSTGSIRKHSMNNGAVLTMDNKVLPNALKLGGFVH